MKLPLTLKRSTEQTWASIEEEGGARLVILNGHRLTDDDAATMVKATNSHSELVEALKEIGEKLTDIPGGYGYYVDLARSALAKADVQVEW